MSLETIALLRATPSTERPTIVAPLLANSSCWRAQLTSCPLQYGHQSPRRKSSTTESPRCSESRHGRPFSSSRVKSTGSASMCLIPFRVPGTLDVRLPRIFRRGRREPVAQQIWPRELDRAPRDRDRSRAAHDLQRPRAAHPQGSDLEVAPAPELRHLRVGRVHAFFYGALLRVTSPFTVLLLLSVIAVSVGQALGIWLWAAETCSYTDVDRRLVPERITSARDLAMDSRSS